MVIIQKFVRDNLGISRRKAEELIWSGRVYVDGVLARPGQMIDEVTCVVTFDKKEITKLKKKLVYIKFNKPAGCVTSKADPHNPETIYAYLPKKYLALSPVGRLDKDTEGLLVLTNDGDFNFKLSHPKFKIEKEYFVVIEGTLKPATKSKLEKGLKTAEITTAPCKIAIVSTKTTKALVKTALTITIHEGQKREIKLMFRQVGHKVLELKRIRLGKLLLGKLKVGEFVEIAKEDII